MNFLEKVENIWGLHGKNIYTDSTEYIFNLLKNKSDYISPSKDMKSGGLYYIKYKYDNLNLYRFVLCVEISKANNKNNKLLIWCININQMTLDDRISLFSNFFTNTIEFNEKVEKVDTEKLFQFNPNDIFQFIKSKGYNYILEAYNLYDIKEIRRISTNILPYFLFLNFSQINYNFLMSIYNKLGSNIEQNNVKDQLKELLEKYEELLSKYDDNSKEYHKILKNFETTLKLYLE